MSAGDPMYNLPGYPYWHGPYYQLPTHYYYGPGRLAPNMNFCPCCDQRLNQNSLGAGGTAFGGAGISISPQDMQGGDPQGYAGYNRNDPA